MSDAIDTSPAVVIDEWRPDRGDAGRLDADVDALAAILHAAVHGGAGVSFVVPFAIADARRFWLDRVLPAVRDRSRRVLVARLDGRIVGTVQLDLPWPPNQPHRADVGKLLVHPDVRRRGIARSLMRALEDLAVTEGRTLLTLDTVTGAPSEALYRSLGYVELGVVPGFALGSTSRQPEAATFMYKTLALA